eukprot:3513702-Pyramimonas_sp.AAC.1
MKYSKVARNSTSAEARLPLEYSGMGCKDMPGWIAGERITCLGVIDGASSLRQVEPMMAMVETSKNLTDTCSQAWSRPNMRPKWIRVDPRRARVGDEFASGGRRQGIEVVGAAGGATEHYGKLEHRNQLFERMLEGVIREAQPQTEME